MNISAQLSDLNKRIQPHLALCTPVVHNQNFNFYWNDNYLNHEIFLKAGTLVKGRCACETLALKRKQIYINFDSTGFNRIEAGIAY